MTVGGSSPVPGPTNTPSRVTVLRAAIRPVIVVPPRAAVNAPLEKTAKSSATPSAAQDAALAAGPGAASGPAGHASTPQTANPATTQARSRAQRPMVGGYGTDADHSSNASKVIGAQPDARPPCATSGPPHGSRSLSGAKR